MATFFMNNYFWLISLCWPTVQCEGLILTVIIHISGFTQPRQKLSWNGENFTFVITVILKIIRVLRNIQFESKPKSCPINLYKFQNILSILSNFSLKLTLFFPCHNATYPYQPMQHILINPCHISSSTNATYPHQHATPHQNLPEGS